MSYLINNQNIRKSAPVVFLCGARDFHAMDWFRTANRSGVDCVIITDLIQGEGFRQLTTESDRVISLMIIDRFLFRRQSRFGHLWRNFVKALVLPIQVILFKIKMRRYANSVCYAHSMYYVWIAWMAGVSFVAVPQGSDILVKPGRSAIFRLLASLALRAAKIVTVDSRAMAVGVEKLSGRGALVIQNGIDIEACSVVREGDFLAKEDKRLITSIRGLTSLYRIKELIHARNNSEQLVDVNLGIVYPFCDVSYFNDCSRVLRSGDLILGRLDKPALFRQMASSILCVSIPVSDSSPRSVYEAIFCGSVVAVSPHGFYDDLPASMQDRIVVVNLDDPEWLVRAYERALELSTLEFTPCERALDQFDQLRSFVRLHRAAIEAG